MSEAPFFVTGGTLRQDAQSYVARSADAGVLEALRAGDFCYVLTSRQMGKSSLMVRAAAQLRAERLAVVVLDLTGIGQNLDVEQWYFSMLTRVGEQVHLEDELEAHWDAHLREAPLQRFMGAIREVYLDNSRRKPLVIFVDEIDYVRSLQKFSADEFFAGIRECYNRRTQDPKMLRLTFCLLGVATPSDLIRDQRMTPFNIGRAIELHDFTADEAQVLADGLSPHRETAHLLLERILSWTSGHPYLTQKLCAEVVKAEAHEVAAVDRVCGEIYLSAQARERDDNLHFVRERVLHSAIDRAALLDAYAKVCRGERVADDHLNPVINELRLSGIVRVVDGFLRVRNQIYARVFDRKWARDNLPDAERRRQRDAFRRGVRRVASLAFVLISLVTALAVYAFQQGQKAETARLEAIAQKQEAIAQKKRAEEKQKEAISEKKRAEEKEQEAIAQTKVAEDEKHEAERQREQTNQIVASLVETQHRIETLLEGLAPLLGDKSNSGVLTQAEDVIQGISDETVKDSRIRLGKAGLRRVFARLYLQLGDAPAARKQALAASATVAAELKDAPADTKLMRLLIDCHTLVGDTFLGSRSPDALQRLPAEDRKAAEAAYAEALSVAEKMLAVDPQDAVRRKLLFETHLIVAQLPALYQKYDEARANYDKVMKWVQSQPVRIPRDLDLDDFRAAIHTQLGSLELLEGKVDAAREQFEKSLALREEAAKLAGPADHDRTSDLAVSLNKIGNVFLATTRWKEALRYHERSLDLRTDLCKLENPKLEWQRNLGFSLNNVAQAMWNLHRETEAIDRYRERWEHTRKILKENMGNLELRTDFTNALSAYVDILLNADKPALRDRAEALDVTKKAVVVNTADPRCLKLHAQALRLNNKNQEAVEAAENAAKLLPAEEQRSSSERALATEIEAEIKLAGPLASRARPTERKKTSSGKYHKGKSRR